MNLDDAVSAVCTITKGDLPIHIWWTLVDDFNGFERNLSTNDGLMITRTSQKLSLLNIDAVKGRHRGNYTCYARNKAGISKHSAFLFINGESKVIVLPIPSSCSYPRRFHEFCNLFSKRLISIAIIENFPLVLPQISPFTFGDEELNLDETVAATCIITKGDLPINIWWSLRNEYQDGDRNLTTNDGVMITKNSHKISVLNIDSVKARHRGNYTCYATNKAGTAQHSAYLAINGLNRFKPFYYLSFQLLRIL